jgi:hypothetical protein
VTIYILVFYLSFFFLKPTPPTTTSHQQTTTIFSISFSFVSMLYHIFQPPWTTSQKAKMTSFFPLPFEKKNCYKE